MTSMQVSSSKSFDTKKLPKVLSSNGLLTKYIGSVKSMNASTALQYRSELNSFAKFVYNAYDCDLDSLIDELYNKGTLQKKTIFDPYEVLSKYTASLVGTVSPITVKHRVLTARNFFDTSVKIEALFGFVRRQSNYYRQACEILGLIQSSAGIFHLTRKGEEYLKLSADEKSRFIGQLLLEFPIMNEIFLKAIMERNKIISIDDIIQIIKKRSYLKGTTLRRRAKTIISWFKWIRNNLGLIEVDRAGNISSSVPI